MAVQVTEKRLCRLRSDAFVGGVCAGIAEYYDLDSIVVRILAILITFLTFGIGVVVYVALWMRVPVEPETPVPFDVTPESAESSAFGCVDCLQAITSHAEEEPVRLPLLGRLAIAAGLMFVFLAVALNVEPLMPGTRWWQFWPLIPLMTGLCLIIIPIRTRFEAAWHAVGIALTSLSASLLPMTLGVMSWLTVGFSLQQFWPILVLSILLTCVGLYRGTDVLVLAGAFCFAVFCIMGLTFCVVPGEFESFLLQMPSGRSLRISLAR